VRRGCLVRAGGFELLGPGRHAETCADRNRHSEQVKRYSRPVSESIREHPDSPALVSREVSRGRSQ
jgi:hypothetical protein